MTVFFGFDTPYMYNGKPLTISNGASPCIMEDKREMEYKPPISRTYKNYCESSGRETPDWAKDAPIRWTKHEVKQGKGCFVLTDTKNEEDITFVISSRGHYARNCGGVSGQISILRRYSVPSFPHCGKTLDKESVSHVKMVYTGNLVERCGQTVSARTACIKIPKDTDAVIMVRRSGYPARFKNLQTPQTWFLVVTDGEFYAVPENEISAFFGGELPWKEVDTTEFHLV